MISLNALSRDITTKGYCTAPSRSGGPVKTHSSASRAAGKPTPTSALPVPGKRAVGGKRVPVQGMAGQVAPGSGMAAAAGVSSSPAVTMNEFLIQSGTHARQEAAQLIHTPQHVHTRTHTHATRTLHARHTHAYTHKCTHSLSFTYTHSL